jgi:flagellar basal body-associated protein FliL
MAKNQNGDVLVIVVVIVVILAITGLAVWAIASSKKQSSKILQPHNKAQSSQQKPE